MTELNTATEREAEELQAYIEGWVERGIFRYGQVEWDPLDGRYWVKVATTTGYEREWSADEFRAYIQGIVDATRHQVRRAREPACIKCPNGKLNNLLGHDRTGHVAAMALRKVGVRAPSELRARSDRWLAEVVKVGPLARRRILAARVGPLAVQAELLRTDLDEPDSVGPME